MRFDIGYTIGVASELLLFMYFVNTSFYPRKKYTNSNLITLIGYIVLYIIGLLDNAPISILGFFVINTTLLTYSYKVQFKSAVFYSLILDALSVLGEYIILYILGFRYGYTLGFRYGLDRLTIVPYQSVALLVGGKLIYFIGIIFLKRFINKKALYSSNTELILAGIPLLTIVCVTILMSAEIDYMLYLVICIAVLMTNFIAFYVHAKFNEKNQDLKILQDEYNKNKAELSEYQLLAEKYESTRIMRHDFRKQLNVLKSLIKSDDTLANEYMQQIQFSQRELDYIQYTDNKILNILFAQKVKECHKRGIEIHIHSESPSLSFISDIDTVAIFSNLIDNAIEATEQSKEKEIFVDLYTVNNSFAAVKVENYADKEPVIHDGLLRSQKEGSDVHGIGIKSINNALKKYNSQLSWSYDKENKFFRAMVLIHIPQNLTV